MPTSPKPPRRQLRSLARRAYEWTVRKLSFLRLGAGSVPPLLHRRLVLYAGLETYVAVSVFRPASLRSVPLQPEVHLVRRGWPRTWVDVSPAVEFGRPGGSKASSSGLHGRTAFPSAVLAEYEAASRAYAECYSRTHGYHAVPLATHVVRIPTGAGDGYFHLVLHHPFVNERTLTCRTRFFRVASLSPPWGAPRGAPLVALFPEIVLAMWGWALLFLLWVVWCVAPAGRWVRKWAPTTVPTAVQLSTLGFRTGLLRELDQRYGSGGVTYWR